MRYKIKPITLGKSVKSVHTEGFILTESKHPPSLTIPRHIHDNANISFVLGGSFTEFLGRHRYDCNSSTLMIKPAGEVHSNQYGCAGAHCLIIEVKPERLDAIRRYTKTLDGAAHLRADVTAQRIYQEFLTTDEVSSLAIEGLMFELIASLTRKKSENSSGGLKAPRWLGEARDFIREQYVSEMSLSVAADYAGVHPAHLAKAFRKFYKCSVGDYVRRLRLERASEQLKKFDKPLTEIALETGFYDYSHFSHAFKCRTGLTPAEYRSLLKECKADTRKLQFSKKS